MNQVVQEDNVSAQQLDETHKTGMIQSTYILQSEYMRSC